MKTRPCSHDPPPSAAPLSLHLFPVFDAANMVAARAAYTDAKKVQRYLFIREGHSNCLSMFKDSSQPHHRRKCVYVWGQPVACFLFQSREG